MSDLDDFLYSRSSYRGQVKPEDLVFNANLQEFAQKVSYLCNLETAGKISSHDAYQQIKTLYEQLDCSNTQLGVGDSPFQNEDK